MATHLEEPPRVILVIHRDYGSDPDIAKAYYDMLIRKGTISGEAQIDVERTKEAPCSP